MVSKKKEGKKMAKVIGNIRIEDGIIYEGEDYFCTVDDVKKLGVYKFNNKNDLIRLSEDITNFNLSVFETTNDNLALWYKPSNKCLYIGTNEFLDEDEIFDQLPIYCDFF